MTVPKLAYRKAILQDNPISYWKLDEKTGTTFFDFVGSNDLSIINAGDVTLNQSSLVSGNKPSASFGGTNGHARINLPAAFRVPPLSMECWFNMTSGGTNTYMLNINPKGADNDGRGIRLNAFTDDEIRIFHGIASGSFQILNSGVTISTGTTYYCAITYDGTTLNLYVNGEFKNSTTDTISFADFVVEEGPDPAQFYVSAARNNTSGVEGNYGFFNGKIDEVAFYSYELSPEQIQRHYNVGK